MTSTAVESEATGPRSPRPTNQAPSAGARRTHRRRPAVAPADLHDSLAHGVWIRRIAPRFRRLIDHKLFPRIHTRLTMGMSSYRVAAWIQREVPADDIFGIETIRLDSLARSLRRYIALLPKSAFLPQSFVEDLVRGAEVDVDVMQELAGLIVAQKQRLTSAYKAEQTLGFPIEQMRREIDLLGQLLAQMLDTQIALGYFPGLPQPFVSVEDRQAVATRSQAGLRLAR
jgi:hypothetical protein